MAQNKDFMLLSYFWKFRQIQGGGRIVMFSVEKILSFLKYEDPESISGLTFPVSEEELSRVFSCEFIPNNERTEEYDLKRMKYFELNRGLMLLALAQRLVFQQQQRHCL